MRTEAKVAALSLTLLFAACSKRPEPTASLPDDLQKDLAAASAPSSQLATAPQSYQRMRFVSDIERTRATTPASRPKVSQRHEHKTPANHASGDPIVSLASHTLETVATPAEAPAPEPTTIAVAAMPAPEPMVAQASGPSDAGVSPDYGGGIGSVIGGIGAVIRGGRASVDKCDPRTDGRARGTVVGQRPDFSMPLPTGQPIFGRRR